MRKQKSIPPAPQAHLDVDWLVGERTDPRLRIPIKRVAKAPWLGVLVGVAFVVATLLAWPQLSNHWLRNQFEAFLRSDETSPEESLAVMLALQELGNANRSIVSQLDDERAPEKRRMAYQLLTEQIRNAARSNDQSFAWLGLAQQIGTLKSQQPECVQLRALLAKDIASQVPSSHPEYTLIQKACQPISAFASGNSPSNEETWSTLNLSENKGSKASLASASLLPPVSSNLTERTSLSMTNEAISVPLPQVDTKDASSVTVASSTIENTTLGSVPGAKSGSNNTMRSVSVSRPLVVVAEPSIAKTPLSFPQLHSYANSGEDTRTALKKNSVAVGNKDAGESDTGTMRGLDQLPLENLFGLLVSPQERRVRMVCDELFRRGVATNVVDVALDLARGDTQQKLDTLERIVRTEDISPIPLLAWMARSSERQVRQKAIAILGSMPDPEAKRRLRSLIHREPDMQLQQQIQQAMASNGTISR